MIFSIYVPTTEEQPAIILSIPTEVWYIPGALATALIVLIGLLSEPQLGWITLSVILGGLTMVAGYFVYDQFFLGVLAYADIPVNIGQMTVGPTVFLPVVRAVHRYLPSLIEASEVDVSAERFSSRSLCTYLSQRI